MKHALAVAACLVFATVLLAQENDETHPADRQLPDGVNSPGFAKQEEGCLGGRILDYLERHGDWGVIHSDVLLERTRETQVRMLAEGAEGIGGTVWTSLGPTNGAGRATAIANHPTTATTALIGAAGGGVWKTTNGGASWTPQTETIANLSVGALSYAPSNASIVYLGTGEGGLGSDFIPGIGLLSSSDGGTNWTLPSTVIATMFYRISVSPTTPNELVVGTNVGGLRSTGGQNGPWTTVIASQSTPSVTGYGDVTDIVRDPASPLVMYATTFDRNSWCARFACADPGIFSSPTVLKSIDGGILWNVAATGLPVSSFNTRVNRMSIAIAPSNTQVLYAATSLYDATTGIETAHIYKTTNGGGSWSDTNLYLSATSSIRTYFNTQAWYDNTIVVAPSDANTVIAGGVYYVKTTDGGTTWAHPTLNGGGVHVDVHDLRYDVGGTLWIANDGGIWTSTDHANTATDRNTTLVTRQFYDLTSDPSNRNRVFGGQQDNGTSRRGDGGGTSWSFFSGSDGFTSAVFNLASSIAFSTYQFISVNRTMDTGAVNVLVSNVTPPYPSSETKPFFSVIEKHPTDPATLYVGSHRVWKSTTGGDGWVALPTTTNDATTWSASGVRGLAISRSNPQVMMVSKYTDVFRSTDGGTSWNRVISGLPGKAVLNLEIDPNDSSKAYAALAGTFGTSVYYTTNGGSSWSARGTGLPAFSAQVVRVDPTDSLTLYCGTDVGVYRSTDGGANWSPFGSGLPAVSVYDIDILRDGTVLRAATHGRGIWELTVTSPTNLVPAVTITTPVTSTLTVAKGSSATFAGSFSDGDGQPLTANWMFPDTWSASTASGAPVSHTFARAGIYPVTLSAADTVGAIGADSVLVTVTESGDDCASPIVIPASGPFPYTVSVETASATTQGSDPNPLSVCYPYTPQSSIWLSFTPPSTASYQFSICGSKPSTVLTAFTGNACGAYSEVPALCIVQTSPGTTCSAQSSATLTAGVPIRLMLTNYYYGDPGRISLTITQSSVFTPTINAVNPVAGPATGGTAVVVTGSGFSGGTTVSFGGVAATSVTIVDANTITAVSPAHAIGTFDVTVTNGTTATLAGGFTYFVTPLSAPAGVVATASSTTNVNVSWSAVAGASSYEVYHRIAGGAWTLIAATASTNTAIGGRTPNTAYLYVVRALGASGAVSLDSAPELATTTIYSNDPAVAGSTVITAANITQLRTAVDAIRALASLPAGSYTDVISSVVPVRAVHMIELRAALAAARTALGLSPVTYTYTPVTNGIVRAADINELRGGTK